MSYFPTLQLKDQYGFTAENTPADQVRTAHTTRLVGAMFVGNAVDANFWTAAAATGGAVTQSGNELRIRVNTVAASGSASVESVRTARFVAGSSHSFRGILRLSDTGVAGSVRRWGAYDANNGFFFELSGTTMNVVTRRAGVDVAVPAASWNGTAWAPTTDVTEFEIYYNSVEVVFAINGVLAHTVAASSGPLADTIHFKARAEDIHTNATADTSIYPLALAILRFGDETSYPMVYHVAAAETRTLKNGPGILRRVVVAKPVNSQTITIYDNTAGSGTILAVITCSGTVPFSLEFEAPFNVGLTYVSSSAAVDATFIYE